MTPSFYFALREQLISQPVPISYHMLLYGALSIAAAHGLQRDDCKCNALLFYHTGGISCNLMEVLVSGGSVLMAGPFHNPDEYLDHLLGKPPNSQLATPSPTWYYAGPTMHKAIVVMAEARYNRANKYNSQQKKQPLSCRLRFIRNAQAHISHSLVLRLSTVFGCSVIPTYGMTEAMPIASSIPIDARFDPPSDVVDSVGFPLTNVRILHPETGEVMEHVEHADDDHVVAGDIALKGPGVISGYLGMDVDKTHTSDGWLCTGDLGVLDKEGRLFIKGRRKEMIKRGGEQVWPNEIDDVLEKVPGVFLACAFGVPNELWGEEVAVAVVLADPDQHNNPAYLEELKDKILQACKDNLDEMSMPQQIKFLKSKNELLRGPTGKIIKSKMAAHLGVTAMDTGALRVLTSVSNQFRESAQPKEQEETNRSFWEKYKKLLETTAEDGHRVIPSDALNGVPFLTTLFVVHGHVGLFPNLPWVKLQGYVPNMMIFFTVGAFQTTCQVAQSVKPQWAQFVGTKIGALHSLFVICQLITYPSYVLFRAFDEDGNFTWDVTDWAKSITWFIFCTITGMGHKWGIIMFTWFQSTYYIFLALFPFLDDYLRRLKLKQQLIWLVISTAFAAALWGLIFISTPQKIFWNDLYPIGWTIITWLPLLVASMLAAYIFRRIVKYYTKKKKNRERADLELQEQQLGDPSSVDAEYIKDYTKLFGMICDGTSLLLLIIWITVAVFPNCLCVYEETAQAMRPGNEDNDGECPFRRGVDDYVWTCDVTYDEFVTYIIPDPYQFEFGRLITNFSGEVGYLRGSAVIFLMWIFTMAFGTGYTSKIFASRLFKDHLAPLGYPVYLIHMAVARYYWVATRGLKREFWWDHEGEFPFPVAWWEFFLILLISIVSGALVNHYLVPPLLPHTIDLGVKCCSWISKCCDSFAPK